MSEIEYPEHRDENGFESTGTRECNLRLELVRVTEAAAYAIGRRMGRGDKEAVDQAAVDARRQALDGVDMHGIVVIGEGGEKDEAPMTWPASTLWTSLLRRITSPSRRPASQAASC